MCIGVYLFYRDRFSCFLQNISHTDEIFAKALDAKYFCIFNLFG